MPEQESREINADIQTIQAFRADNEVWIIQGPALNTIDNYFHEAGHVLGDHLSFRAGTVLTPDEVKSTSLSLDEDTTNRIEKILLAKKVLKKGAEIDEFINLGTRILRVFTKGTFNPQLIKLHTNVSHKGLIAVIKKMGGANTLEFTSDNDINFVYSKEGRNSEIPSHTFEVGCIQILVNTIQRFDPHYRVTFSKSSSPSHHRALSIVQRAYARTGWTLPSALDLYQ